MVGPAGLEPAAPKPRIDSIRRMQEDADRAVKAGITPYVAISRELPEGGERMEAYGLDGKLLTTGTLSGDGSVGRKLYRRKGRYTDVLGAFHTFKAGEAFSMDALKTKMLRYDDERRADLAERDRLEREGVDAPDEETNPVLIAAVRKAIEGGASYNAQIAKRIMSGDTTGMGDLTSETKSGTPLPKRGCTTRERQSSGRTPQGKSTYFYHGIMVKMADEHTDTDIVFYPEIGTSFFTPEGLNQQRRATPHTH